MISFNNIKKSLTSCSSIVGTAAGVAGFNWSIKKALVSNSPCKENIRSLCLQAFGIMKLYFYEGATQPYASSINWNTDQSETTSRYNACYIKNSIDCGYSPIYLGAAIACGAAALLSLGFIAYNHRHFFK
ncbi:MAG: hypothetical protein KR126chlam5_00251 [Candidatus Anoxychlamydiales bacterium]|nr:hypothetical protein [Candidatus Anoxychlamydiales bacterium]